MIFVSTLYDVRSRVQGTEHVEREQDRQSTYKHDIEARSINKYCHGKATKSGVHLRFCTSTPRKTAYIDKLTL